MSNVIDEQRAKFEAHEKAQFKIWAESKFSHIAVHMRWAWRSFWYGGRYGR